MRAELKTLLTKLGVSTENITALSTDEGSVDVNALYQATRDNLAEALKNDEAFIQPIKASVRGEVLSSKERKLMKQFGVTQEEYDALPQNTKFDSLIDLCGTKAKPSGASDEAKAEIDKLRAKIVEKEERIKKLTEEEIPAIKSTVERERAEVVRKMELQKALKKAVGDKKLIVSEDAAMAVINADLGNKFDFVLENGEFVVYKKGSTEIKAFDENNRQVTVESAFQSALASHKLIQLSNGGAEPPPPPQPPKPGEGKGDVIVPPGLAKAQAAIEKRKAAQA
jgi:hypothetical protein